MGVTLLRRTFTTEQAEERALIEGLGREIANGIWQRFLTGPTMWRAKHVRWFLADGSKHLSMEERQTCYRVARRTVVGMRNGTTRWEGFRPYLKGPWVPADLAIPAGEGPTDEGLVGAVTGRTRFVQGAR